MNTPHTQHGPAIAGELLEEAALTLEDLAHACCVEPGWVVERLEAGLLEGAGSADRPGWRFTSASLVRARRMVHLEQGFDANPELAALAADLIEEIARLRERLRAAGLRD